MRFKMDEFSVSLQDITVILINCRHLITKMPLFLHGSVIKFDFSAAVRAIQPTKIVDRKKIRIETTSQSIMYSSD